MYFLSVAMMAAVILALVLIIVAMIVHGYFMLRNRVPYVVLPEGAMAEVSRALDVRAGAVVYDLGCGDGRVILNLRQANSQARFIGVENDWTVWVLANLRVRGRAQIVRGEISQTPLASATRIFVYLGPKMMSELETRFKSELPHGAKVVSVQFPLPSRTPDAVVELPQSQSHARRLYLYNY